MMEVDPRYEGAKDAQQSLTVLGIRGHSSHTSWSEYVTKLINVVK
jgi:hypothetical protein